MIARTLFLLFLCIALLTLSGCWDRKEVNDIAIIAAAGVDKKEENKIELSVLVFIPRAGGGQQMGDGGGGGGGQQTTLVRSAVGVNLADAMSRLQKKLPRRIFWGHNEVFVIDEELARDGITEKIDFLMRHPEPRERMNIFISKEKSKEILRLKPPLEQDLSRVLLELAAMKTGLQVTSKDLALMLIGDAQAAAVPYIQILPPETGQEKTKSIAYITGTAVLKEGKMIGRIDESATRGVMWLRNEMKTAIVTIHPEFSKGEISTMLIKARSQLIPSITNGKWKITIKAEMEDDIIQNATELNVMEPQIIKMLEKELEKDIDERIHTALQKVQKEMNADIFGFADAFHRAYPGIWKTSKKSWDEIFPNVEVTVEAKSRIRRPGLTGEPMLPEEEVKKK